MFVMRTWQGRRWILGEKLKFDFVDRPAITSTSRLNGMLPPEILDQITRLKTQHRQVISIIYRLSRSSEITSQLILDDLTSRIKVGFAKADQGIETPGPCPWAYSRILWRWLKLKRIYLLWMKETSTLLNLTKTSNCTPIDAATFLICRARVSFRKLLLQASKTLNQTRHAQA